jgi:hypothetical protein
MHLFARQAAPLRAEVDRMMEIDAAHPLSYMGLGCLHLLEEHATAAVAAFGRASQLAGRPVWLLGFEGLACGIAGEQARARALFDELQTLSRDRFVSPFAIGMTAFGLGEMDLAFQQMARAIDARDPLIIPLRYYPFLDALKSDRRYTELLARMNLTD